MKKLFLIALLAVTGLVHAAGSPSVAAPDAFERFMQQATGTGKQTISFGTNGTPLTSPGVPTITADGGLPRVDTGGNIRNPSGNSYPVTASGRVAGASVGAALGRFMGKALPILATGVALYELAKELGFNMNNSSGTVVVSKDGPVTCSAVTQPSPNPAYTGAGWSYSWQSFIGPKSPTTGSNWSLVAGECAWGWAYVNSSYSWSKPSDPYVPGYTKASPLSPQLVPSTQQEFVNAVAAKSGWPSGSWITNALLDATTVAPYPKVEVGPVTVTGPATSPGTTTTTNNVTNNTTKTDVVTHNHTYEGPNVTTTTVTTSTVTNNIDNSVVSQTTTTDKPVSAEPAKETCGLPGTPACKIDETGTPVYDSEKLKLDKATLDTASQAQRNTIQGSADKSMFASWSSLFTLPALRACEPVVLPTYVGVNLGSYDVCPGAEWVRGLMAWVWAVAGFAFVFKTVEGVI